MTKGGEATVRRRRAWLLSLAALEPPCRPVERFSPTWWAAWTCALHRPGRLDDENIPDGIDGVTPWWDHTLAMGRAWDRERRQDWPTMAHAQERCEPTPTDWCCVDGRCVGTCNRGDGDA